MIFCRQNLSILLKGFFCYTKDMVDKLKKIDLNSPKTEIASPIVSPELIKKVIIYLVVVFLGIGSGYLLYKINPSTQLKDKTVITTTASTSGLKVGDVIGIKDESQFKDKPATGVLEEGGLNGEGSHKLLRPGGNSQTVYLTSTVLDLDQFIGHKVTVWGDTYSAQKAGWLMDVGRVKIEELNAATPSAD